MVSTDSPVYFWLEAAGRYPLLPQEEILRLGGIIQNKTSSSRAKEKAIQKIITHNLRLIPGIVKKSIRFKKSYKFGDDATNDLLQSGVIGLRKAAEKFDPTRGYAFSTYAWSWIYQSVQRELYRNLSIIRIPESALVEMYKSIAKNNGLSFEDISSSRRQRFVDIYNAMQCLPYNSLEGDLDGLERNYCGSINPLKEQKNQFCDNDRFKEMESFEDILEASTLTDEQKYIVTSIYQDSTGKAAIAEASGLTISRVRTLHRKSLAGLRQAMVC